MWATRLRRRRAGLLRHRRCQGTAYRVALPLSRRLVRSRCYININHLVCAGVWAHSGGLHDRCALRFLGNCTSTCQVSVLGPRHPCSLTCVCAWAALWEHCHEPLAETQHNRLVDEVQTHCRVAVADSNGSQGAGGRVPQGAPLSPAQHPLPARPSSWRRLWLPLRAGAFPV